MKKLMLGVWLWWALTGIAEASPYFRFLDPAHLQISAGAFVDPTSAITDYGSMIALITHSPKDGSITGTKTIWTPLALGGGYGNGHGFMAIGPSCNVSPVVKGILLKGLEAITEQDRYISLKSLLAPKTDESPDITFAMGPSVMVNLIEGGDFIRPDKWRAQTRIFAGAKWTF